MAKNHTNPMILFKEIYKALPQRRKRQLWVLFVGMLFMAVMETLFAGSVAFFATSIADPDSVMQSRYAQFGREYGAGWLFASPQTLVASAGVVVVSLLAMKNVLTGMVVYGTSRFAAILEAVFGSRLLGGFLRIPYEWHLSKNSADLVTAIQWATYFGKNYLFPCLQLVKDVLLIVCMLTALMIASPSITMFVVVAVGVFGFLIFERVKKRLDQLAGEVRDGRKYLNRHISMGIHGIKDIRVIGGEDAIHDEYADKMWGLSRILGERIFISRLPSLLLEFLGILVLVASVCLLMFYMDYSQAVITGTISLLAVTAWRVMPAVSGVLSSLATIRASVPFVSNELEYLDEVGEFSEQSRTGASEGLQFVKEIGCRNVSFSYLGAEKTALEDVSFTIQRGKALGVIGVSGSGKSTLVDVLIGLLPPAAGDIVVDGVPLTDANMRSWMERIGYVPQSSYLADATLAENIAFGVKRDDIDEKRVLECCETAAIDFLGQLSQGVWTPVGERGVMLSGGQRQRVAIARALYRSPEVLVFDEATSSLDSASEKAIQETVYSLKGMATLVIIAHRLSTVEDCDELIWIKDGTVHMTGSPKEVLAKYVGEERGS